MTVMTNARVLDSAHLTEESETVMTVMTVMTNARVLDSAHLTEESEG
jgi:hypothetical protein